MILFVLFWIAVVITILMFFSVTKR